MFLLRLLTALGAISYTRPPGLKLSASSFMLGSGHLGVISPPSDGRAARPSVFKADVLSVFGALNVDLEWRRERIASVTTVDAAQTIIV